MRRSGVRIPLAPPQADIRSGCRFFCMPGRVGVVSVVVVLVASLVFRALRCAALGPGRCVCRWAAARPRDRHTRACGSEWSISRPALALPPPTGTAAGPRHRPRAPQPDPAADHGHRSLVPPLARLGGLTSFGAAPRSPPVPSEPSGAFHTSGAWLLMCGLARRLEARPGPAIAHGHRRQALRILRHPPHRWHLVCGCVD